MNNIINDIIEEVKNSSAENSQLMKFYENMISHFTIFSLLNEVYLHKANQPEESYETLKGEIKALSDVVKKLRTALEKTIAEESNKKELGDIKRKINTFRNSGLQQDVIYETINL